MFSLLFLGALISLKFYLACSDHTIRLWSGVLAKATQAICLIDSTQL